MHEPRPRDMSWRLLLVAPVAGCAFGAGVSFLPLMTTQTATTCAAGPACSEQEVRPPTPTVAQVAAYAVLGALAAGVVAGPFFLAPRKL